MEKRFYLLYQHFIVQSNGVSTLVGFILLLLIGMVFLSVVQTQVIPGILKDVEIKHMDEITDDLLKLSSNLLACKLSTVEFDLGVKYPKYLFLLTPQSIPSTISCNRFPFKLNYTDVNGKIYNLSNIGIDKNVRLEITLKNFVNPTYELIFENTAIFKKLGNRFLILSDQKMFLSNAINVYIINTSFSSISTTFPIDLIVVPISYGGENPVNEVTITFKSVYPEYWNKTLRSLGYKVEVNKSSGIVKVEAKNVTVRIHYIFITKSLSISVEESSEMYKTLRNITVIPTEMIRATYIGVNPITISVGQSLNLGVRVLDQFRNPVSGVKVKVSVNPSDATVTPTETYTDSNGYAYSVFSSNRVGNYNVVFYSPDYNLSVSYDIYVVSGGGTNISITLSCPEGWDTDGYSQKTIIAYVTGNGQPLPNCDVVFSANSSNVVFNPSRVITNESGYAATKVSQTVMGANSYKIYAYALSAYNTHDILLNTTIPPDVHILKVYIENLMNSPLDDYQVRITIDKSILAGIQPDGRDLRVTEAMIDPYNETAGKLPFWIEQKPSTGKLVFWVKVNLSARENKTIYVYWSGRDVSSESNGDKVFIFFDDFNRLDKNKWVISNTRKAYVTIVDGRSVIYFRDYNNRGVYIKSKRSFNPNQVVVELMVKFIGYTSGDVDFSAGFTHVHTYIGVKPLNMWEFPHSIYIDSNIVAMGSKTAVFDWRRLIGKYISGSLSSYYDGELITSHKTHVYTSDQIRISMDNWDSPRVAVDWILVRKYAEIEPKVTIGNPIQ